MKLTHLADLHIGVESFGHINPNTGLNRRVEDFLARLDDCIDWSIDQSVDAVLFAGDAFKLRTPTMTQQNELAKRFKRLSDSGIPLVAITGNHDVQPIKGKASTISIFHTLSLPNVFVYEEPGVYVITTNAGPLVIGALPYPTREQVMAKSELKGLSISQIEEMLIDELLDTLVGMNTFLESAHEFDAVPRVLMAHLAVAGADMGNHSLAALGNEATIHHHLMVQGHWDYVALGHLHKHQDLHDGKYPPVVYSGSLERVDFSEEGDVKGWVEVSVERGKAQYRHIPQYRVPPREFVTLHVDVPKDIYDPKGYVLSRFGTADLSDKIVRVEVQVDEAQAPHLLRRELEKALSHAYFLSSLNIQARNPVRVRKQENVEGLGPMELLERYLRTKATPEDRLGKLLREAEEIMRESRESAEEKKP